MERFVVISADCHAVGRPEDFTQYLEAQYLDDFDAESLEQRSEFAEGRAKASEEGGLLFSRETLDEYHGHEETEEVAGGTVGQWDSDRRVKELEDDGVVGEVVFPNGGPFVTGRGGESYHATCAPPGCSRTTGGWPTSARRPAGGAPASRSFRSTTSTSRSRRSRPPRLAG